jgi:hypothetical protein
MLKNMRVLAVAGLVAAVVALSAASLTETASVSADRGTRADSDGYMQLAWGDDVDGERGGGVSAARSGR